MRRAFKTLAFMAAWDVAREKMRRDAISLQEYAEYWNVSRSASFREQATFREAFPDEDTPERLLNLAQQQWDVRAGAAGLGRVKLA
jgi:Zn-dependent peptidase ImmA (M78 family)